MTKIFILLLGDYNLSLVVVVGCGCDIFDLVADTCEVLLESVLADDYCTSAVVGMEAERSGIL